jgi:PAS domain S-box-containing protein
LQDGWLIAVSAVLLAMVAVVWAVILVGRARRGRRILAEAVEKLGQGDLGRRLDERQVGWTAAAAFNQAARDLEERLESALTTARSLRAVAAGLPDRVTLELNEDAEVREVLGDLETLTGHTRVGVMGRHAAYFFASDEDWIRLAEEVHATADEGRTVSRLTVLRRRDGELMRGEVRIRVHPDGGYWLALLEPTAGPEAERQVTELEGRLRALVDGLPDGVLILLDGRIASMNPRLARLLGTHPEDLAGRPFLDLVEPGDIVQATSLLSEKELPEPVETGLRLRAPGGDPVELKITVGHAVLERQSVRVLLARDATLERGTQRRLALSGAWLAAALEAGRDGVAVLVRDENADAWPLALVNSAFTRLLGLAEDRLPDRADLALAAQRRLDDPQLLLAFLRGLERMPAAIAEAVFETREEPSSILELRGSPVKDARDRIVGLLLVVADVTTQRRREEDLRRRVQELDVALVGAERVRRDLEGACDELTGKIGELEKLSGDLKERDEMKTNLLANFSHELQTPLVSIKGYTEMMLRGDLGGTTTDQRQGLEVCLRNVQRLVSLIDQLMTFARTEEELAELTLESFPVWPVLEENISLLGDRVKEKELKVTTRYLTQRLTVMADRGLTGQVFSNLLGNAVKYSQKGGEVGVTVREGAADELLVEIRDTGVGIPREEQERIFERGYRASTAGGTRGSGIGLSLVREILKRHGCQIRVDSRPGEGSTFSFTLPLAPAEDEPIAAGGE